MLNRQGMFIVFAACILTGVGPHASGQAPSRLDPYGDPLPEGALGRLGTARMRHGKFTNRIAFLADNKTLISLDYGYAAITFWDRVTGKELRRIRPQRDSGGHPQLAPNRELVAIVSAGSVKVHELESGKCLYEAELPSTDEQLFFRDDAFFSADSRMLAIVEAGGGHVDFLDARTGKKLHGLELSEERLREKQIVTLPDGRRAIIRREPGHKYRVCDATSGKVLYKCAGDGMVAPVFSSDGRHLAITGKADRGVRLYDAVSGIRLQEIAAKETVNHLEFSADSKTLAIGTTNAVIRLWDVLRLEERAALTIPVGEVESILYSRDNKTLVAVTGPLQDRASDRTFVVRPEPFDRVAAGKKPGVRVQSWHLPDTKAPLQFTLPRLPECTCWTLSDDGKMLACLDVNTIRRWDVLSGKELSPGPMSEITHLAIAPDSRLVAVVHADRQVNIWESKSQQQRKTLRLDGEPTGEPRFTTGGKSLMVLTREPPARQRWDVDDNFSLKRDPLQYLADAYHHSLAPDGRPVGLRMESTPSVFIDLRSGKDLGRFKTDDEMTLFIPSQQGIFSPDCWRFARAAFDKHFETSIVQWDFRRGREFPRVVTPSAHGGPVEFSADGRFLVTGSALPDPETGVPLITFACWETATGKELFRLPPQLPVAVAVALAPDGRRLARSWIDGTITIWDTVTAKELGRLDGHHGNVTHLRFAPDGMTLFSAGEDTTVLIWDLTRLTPKREPPGSLTTYWAELARTDPVLGCRALWALVDAPAQAVPFLADRLKPAAQPDQRRVLDWIAGLGSEEFETRQAATKELEELGWLMEAPLLQALKKEMPIETRRRLQQLRDQIDGIPASEELRRMRAVHALELIGSEESRTLLVNLAKGADRARQTREARDALQRLRHYAP
jgi:WD40 repeat protein